MKVYVLQDDGTKNLFPATKFGKIITFTGKKLPQYSQDWIQDLDAWLANFDAHQDYLMLIGDPCIIGVACAIVAQQHGILPVLKWDRQHKDYVSVKLDLEEVMPLLE